MPAIVDLAGGDAGFVGGDGSGGRAGGLVLRGVASGARNSGFVHAQYCAEDDRKHSYWGVGYPTHQDEGGSASALLCGQKLAREVPAVSEQAGWDAIEFLVDGLVPSHNLFYAIRIDGEFASVTVREAVKQQRPFRGLADAVGTGPLTPLDTPLSWALMAVARRQSPTAASWACSARGVSGCWLRKRESANR
mgnify:CR=1 FL=1